ncbi:MAG: PhnD/SsuA/transferrin family substrate-binding protein [Pseudomonadota bacterium]
MAEPLAFAPLPMESPETVSTQWKPLLDYLGKSLGEPVRIEYSDDYGKILDKFRAGKLDLAYLGPLPYVTLKEKFPAATPVVHFNEQNGQPTYSCAIVALEERKLALKNIKGLRIALTQPLSTCGYLSTDGLLRRAGSDLEKNRYRYLDKHDAVALAVARGDYDAGGLKTAIGRKYLHLGLMVLAESPPLPSFALIANGTRLSAERIEQIRQALTRAQPGTTKSWGDNIRHGAVPANDRDYDAVRQLRGRADIPERDNF